MIQIEKTEPLFPILTSDVYLDSEIALISGHVRDGKGLLAMQLLKLMGSKRPLRVFSNFPIHPSFLPNSEFFFMEQPQDFLNIQYNNVHQIAILDEPNKWGLESRRSQSDLNVEVAGKIQQCGHFNMDVIIITQLYSMVDPRGRRLEQSKYYAIGKFDKKNYWYAKLAGDYSIECVFNIPIWSAEKFIYPYYSTTHIISNEEKKQEEIGDIVITK